MAQQDADDAPAPVVDGQIFDHLGGGVENVHVALRRTDSATEEAPIASTETDEFGDFRVFHDQPLAGTFVITFQKSGYADVSREIVVHADRPPPFVDLSLPGGLALAGVVRDQRGGEPIAKASVAVDVAGREWRTETDARGAFHVEEVLPGPARISVVADGFARSSVESTSKHDSAPVEILLSPERIVEFRTVDAINNPVPAATLELLDPETNDYRSLTTDESGLAVARNLSMSTEQILVRATHPRFVSDDGFDRRYDLPADLPRSTQVVTLAPASRLIGTVTSADTTRPLLGARVDAADLEQRTAVRAWTDGNGRFELNGARPGENVVTVYLNGFAPELRNVTTSADQPQTVDFALGPPHEAGGTLVDADGNPVPNAYLYATRWRGHPALGAQTLTGPDGTFTLHNLPADPFDVAIEAAGFKPADGQTVTPGRTDHRFVLDRGGAPPGMLNALNPGDEFPELEFTPLDHPTMGSVDWKGKTVLVDFWATWCGPCIAEIPTLRAIHDKYRNRDDFMLVSISIDADSEGDAVRRAIRKHQMAWIHVFGKDAGAENAANACGVSFIPQTFLVDRDGKLIAASLVGRQLREAVQTALKSP